MEPMENNIDVHLGKRLRRRRRLLGLTQQQLAGACGVRFQQIQKYECGQNRVSVSRLFQLAETLGVEPAALVAEVERRMARAPVMRRGVLEKPNA